MDVDALDLEPWLWLWDGFEIRDWFGLDGNGMIWGLMLMAGGGGGGGEEEETEETEKAEDGEEKSFVS